MEGAADRLRDARRREAREGGSGGRKQRNVSSSSALGSAERAPPLEVRSLAACLLLLCALLGGAVDDYPLHRLTLRPHREASGVSSIIQELPTSQQLWLMRRSVECSWTRSNSKLSNPLVAVSHHEHACWRCLSARPVTLPALGAAALGRNRKRNVVFSVSSFSARARARPPPNYTTVDAYLLLRLLLLRRYCTAVKFRLPTSLPFWRTNSDRVAGGRAIMVMAWATCLGPRLGGGWHEARWQVEVRAHARPAGRETQKHKIRETCRKRQSSPCWCLRSLRRWSPKVRTPLACSEHRLGSCIISSSSCRLLARTVPDALTKQQARAPNTRANQCSTPEAADALVNLAF